MRELHSVSSEGVSELLRQHEFYHGRLSFRLVLVGLPEVGFGSLGSRRSSVKWFPRLHDLLEVYEQPLGLHQPGHG